MNKKKILIICFIFIFLGICFTLSANKTNVHGLSNIEEISEEYTSSDFFYNGGSTYSIHEYAVSIEDKDYAVHSKNAQLTNVQGEYRLNIQGNDPIVSVIPIDYFKTIGNHLFIGLEYGFFVETIQEKYYNNGVKTSNNYRSTVIVFDIINSTDLVYNIDRALFTVEVLFQIEFAYVVSNEDYFYQRSSVENVSYANDFVNFTNSVTYTLPNGINGYVVPLRDTNNESQISKYYLNDISFGASLQNEQDLNYGDGNYDPYNDIGSYFTRLDYIYNGFYLVEGEVNWGDVGTGLIEGVVSGALGLLPPPYSTIFNVLTLLFDTCDSIIEQSSTKSVSASNDKYIMNAYYQNRDDQIDAYNALSKMAYVSLNTTDDFSILYDVGDYARVEYTINHSALNGVSPNYTRLSSEIALKVVDKDKNLKAIETSCNDHMLREPVEELITIGNSNLISLLSEGNNYFSFTPTYTGKYIFSSQTNTSIAVTFNNSTYMGESCNDEYLKPCIGVIVGRQVYAGNITDVSMNLDTQVVKGNLKELGMLWWKKSQFEYVNTTIAGRVG